VSELPTFVDGVTPINAETFNGFAAFVEGARDQTVQARDEAVAAAGLATAPTDGQVAGLVQQQDSATRAALDGRFATTAALGELQSESASIEDLWVTALLSTGSIAAVTGVPAFIAPYPLIVTSFQLVAWSGAAVPASDTSYWSISPRRVPDGTGGTGWVIVSTRTTKATGGAPLVARNPWSFDGEQFTSNELLAGEMIDVAFIPTGAPAPIGGPVVATIGFRPL
jgi:pyruvoyl-dependent arginine decarboxylase (PvlArgDC)